MGRSDMPDTLEELTIPGEIYSQIEQIVAHSMRFKSVDDFVSFLLSCYLARPEKADLPSFQLDTVNPCR